MYTLQHPVTIHGVALHSGKDVTCTISPKEIPFIAFKRKDWENSIPATLSHIQTTELNTMLYGEEGNIHTIEHLMCALHVLHIAFVEVVLSSNEVPILDGSAGPWVDLLKNQRNKTNRNIPTIIIKKKFQYSSSNCKVSFHPTLRKDVHLCIHGKVNFPPIGEEIYTYKENETNIKDFIWAKTFGYTKDLESLHAQNLALGANETNAIGITDSGVYNKNALMYSSFNFIRHKMLDFIGDLYTAGAFIFGDISFNRTGHAHTHQALQQLFNHQDSFQIRS